MTTPADEVCVVMCIITCSMVSFFLLSCVNGLSLSFLLSWVSEKLRIRSFCTIVAVRAILCCLVLILDKFLCN